MATEKKQATKAPAKKKAANKKKTVKRKRVILTFKGEPGSDVFVAGSFNKWAPDQKKMKEKKEGEYQITMMLPPGEYEYKFINNGRWQANPDSESWAPNPFGSLNSVLKVEA